MSWIWQWPASIFRFRWYFTSLFSPSLPFSSEIFFRKLPGWKPWLWMSLNIHLCGGRTAAGIVRNVYPLLIFFLGSCRSQLFFRGNCFPHFSQRYCTTASECFSILWRSRLLAVENLRLQISHSYSIFFRYSVNFGISVVQLNFPISMAACRS